MNNVFSLVLASIFVLAASSAEAKKFNRALVIAGGGISPSLSLGILKAAEESGWIPDVVITTCGSSMGSAIYNAYMNADQSLAYAQSAIFHQGLQQVRLNNNSLMDIGSMFDSIQKNNHQIPNFFSKHILVMPNAVDMSLPNVNFNRSSHGPRFIMVSAQALFQPHQVGALRPRKMFQEVFFTDPDTAASLKGFRSPLASLPVNYVTESTRAISDKSTEVAMRASVSDPYLINPPLIDGSYYFTGAVDLFPLELAQFLADEVVMTYPVSLFDGPMDIAFSSAFGFTQTSRTLQVLNNDSQVKWIDMAGADALKFDPQPGLITADGFLKITNEIPKNLNDFQRGIRKQFDFGRQRMLEALRVNSAGPTRAHLREPINPKLYQSFTCDNANAWKTAEFSGLCTEDWNSCNRRKTRECKPVR